MDSNSGYVNMGGVADTCVRGSPHEYVKEPAFILLNFKVELKAESKPRLS